MFKDREDAAMQLVSRLEKYRGKNGIVLAVPRGGLPIGYIISRELKLPLEVILSKKIGHPANPEFAVGSVSLHGVVINDNYTDITNEYIQKEALRIRQDLEKKFKLFMGDEKPADLKNKTVIIVDDGVATGSTIKATVADVREKKPKEIVIAIPVCPPDTARKLKKIADDFICLNVPSDFFGVGQYYYDFSEVSDEEVIRLLKEAKLHSIFNELNQNA